MNLNPSNVQKFSAPNPTPALFSNSSVKSHTEPTSDFHQQFRDQFEDFFGGESSKVSSPTNQSGSIFFKYNEEEEYVENLVDSGNFPKVTLNNFKNQKKARSNVQLLNEKPVVPKTAPLLLKEMESLKTYENILDLDGMESMKFNQLTLESMHMRQTSVKKQQKKVSYLINQTTKNNSPTRTTPGNSDKKPGSARYGNRPISRQSPRVSDPVSARSISKNVEQGLTKKESIKKIIPEKKEQPSPKVDVVKVEPIIAVPIKIEDDRYGKSASPGLRKSHQVLLADTSMEIP